MEQRSKLYEPTRRLAPCTKGLQHRDQYSSGGWIREGNNVHLVYRILDIHPWIMTNTCGVAVVSKSPHFSPQFTLHQCNATHMHAPPRRISEMLLHLLQIAQMYARSTSLTQICILPVISAQMARYCDKYSKYGAPVERNHPKCTPHQRSLSLNAGRRMHFQRTLRGHECGVRIASEFRVW